MSFTYKDGSLTVPGVATLLKNIVAGEDTSSVSGMSVDLGKGGPQKMQKMQTLVMQTKTDSAGKPVDGESGQKPSGGGSISAASTLPGFVTCDQRLNSIIIRDRYENMSFYEDIIKQLDVPCEVIKIDVAILDINRSDGLDLGVDFIGFTKAGKRTLNITPASLNAKNTVDDVSGSAFTQLKGILKGYDITSYVKALEDNGNSQTIAKPSVLTLDNVGAVIAQDSTAHIKVAGNRAEGLYDVTATTKLQVVPHIIPGELDERGKHKMKMFVNIQDSSLTGTDTAGATPGVDSSSINTQAVLYEGQSLLIGGYFREAHSKTKTGVPFIMNLPLIGNIFQHTANSTSVKERIYLISPTIVDINSDENEFDRFLNNKPFAGKYLLSAEEFVPKSESKKRKLRIHKPKLSKLPKRKSQRRI
jgi:type III secretion protein C